jgi:hypothetical protein
MSFVRASNTSVYTNYYVTVDCSRSGNTTALSFDLDLVLASDVSLGAADSRRARFLVGNEQIGILTLKNTGTTWTAGSTHSYQAVFDAFTPEAYASLREVRIVIDALSGTLDATWTDPLPFLVDIPALPEPELAPTAIFTDETVYLPGAVITVSWTMATPAAFYELCYSDAPYASWYTLAVTANTYYLDTATSWRGQSHKYRVVAVGGNTTDWLESLPVTVKKLPPAPAGLSLSAAVIAPGALVEASFNPVLPVYGTAERYELGLTVNGLPYNNDQVLARDALSPITLPTAGLSNAAYGVRIRTIDSYGEASAWSAAASLTIREPVFGLNQSLDPVFTVTAPENPQSASAGYDTVGLSRVMRQLKQVDLYRAKYLDANLADQNAWCFHGGQVQGWTGLVRPLLDPCSTRARAALLLTTALPVEITGLSLDVAVRPYLSLAYILRWQRVTLAAEALAPEDTVSFTAKLNNLGLTVTTDPASGGLLLGNYQFCSRQESLGQAGSVFRLRLAQYIQYVRAMAPLQLQMTVTLDSRAVVYLLPQSPYGYARLDLTDLAPGTVTGLAIEPLPGTVPGFYNCQLGLEYVKLDTTDVFVSAPLRYSLAGASDENAVRAVVEQYFGLTSQTAVWSDGLPDARIGDTIAAAWLENFEAELADKLTACGTCDVFTCTCNGLHYGAASCTACHGTPGLGADTGTPCTQCYTASYTTRTAQCPSNVIDLGCKCGYASNPMCNTNTCQCNAGTAYRW